ncbi:hypothetical protein K437DRAFT_13855 [Tilletiaria anomala UBC 951]|uniref:Uncharacterized protein n=1 Tax=Tilletiaria anomala (strain ATCC 24038 / CBS 436.72 / UBC 951) TaxID=1037660 RepID=A0A066VCS4_TILAU|nr:uncharacterized protein K437DRAFT_13855 [Tilletiaria anomala UBC 951]KDN39261.1 hypothetical protein K437DRAFT_13855 [Tilletiaria anomala UBC 951]
MSGQRRLSADSAGGQLAVALTAAGHKQGSQPASTQDAFMTLVHYDMNHRKSLEHSSFKPHTHQQHQQQQQKQQCTYANSNDIQSSSSPAFASAGYGGTGSFSPSSHAQFSAAANSSTSRGKVRQAALVIDKAEQQARAKAAKKSKKDAKNERRAEATASKAEKRRIKAARREQKKDPIHGDALPHMPDTILDGVDKSGLPGDRYTALPTRSTRSSLGKAGYDEGYYDTLADPLTPMALKGGNAVLVDREMKRLRDAGVKELRMRWRMWTGAFSLIVLAMTTYFMARYIISWLNLSPGTIPLSNAPAGSRTPIDELARLLCLVDFSAAAGSIAGILAVVVYLRATRRRTCGLAFAWFCAVLSTTLQLASAAANLALIILWHRQYTVGGPDASSPQGATRDVGRRCAGTWDFDLLWNASDASPLSTDAQDCKPGGQGGKAAVKMFVVAGGVRLGLIVIFFTLWLIALARYNHTLEKGVQEIGGVEESAEMHRLLEEEMKHGVNGPGNFDEKTLTKADVQQYAAFVEERYMPEAEYEVRRDDATTEKVSHAHSSTQSHRRLDSERTQMLAMGNSPPRLDRFHWQRGEASTATAASAACGGDYRSVPVNEAHAVDDYPLYLHSTEHHLGHGEREPSSLLAKVWDSLWGTSAHPHTDLQRNGSKLGVSGWFHGREPTMDVGSEAASRATSVRRSPNAYDVDERHQQAQSSSNTAGHKRTPSQERRAAAAKAMANAGHTAAGDDLPHMPEVQSITAHEILHQTRHYAANSTWGSDDSTDSANNTSGDRLSVDARNEHVPQYVRTLGKLVRKLSAIESVGSAERADRSERTDNSQGHLSNRSSVLSPSISSSRGVGGGNVIGTHTKRASWNASHGTRLESTSELPDENGSPERHVTASLVPHAQHVDREGSAASNHAPFPGGWA